jgi:Tol biopolymer transport system component
MRRSRKSRWIAGASTFALVASWLVTEAGPATGAFPGRNGKLYCNTTRFGISEIIALDPDGVEPPRRLTFNAFDDIEPTPSPDGTRIAFTSTREDRDQEIWVMYQDGSGARRLTFTPGEDRPGTFSPDGTKIAFQSARFEVPPGPGHSRLEIFVMNADGTDQRRMTNNNFQDSFAHWSPNGDRIAFTTNRDGDVEIYTMVPVDADNDGNADVQTRITNSPNEDAHAHWSPDGSQLTFHSRRDFERPGGFDIEIYRASSVDGSGAVRLTNDGEFDAFPVWSPDGQKIAWSRQFPSEVFTMNALDGSNKTNITNDPADDTRCDWARLLPCTITGAGVIIGTPGDDVICGSPGDDRIFAGGGNDVIYAGAGNDWVDAGAGNDIVFGGPGNDRIFGGDGNDTLFGDQGDDQLDGGPGDDIVSGSEGFDQVVGGLGTDECYGEALAQCP